MGKQRRTRKKIHIPSKNNTGMHMDVTEEIPQFDKSYQNPFESLKINMNDLNSLRNDDDIGSLKSFKSFKSSKTSCSEKSISKKDKLKLRKEFLLKRIDTVNQLKKQAQKSRKGKKGSEPKGSFDEVMPELQSLLVSSESREKIAAPRVSKPKNGIPSASKRRKNTINNIKIYKEIVKNKSFQENALAAISAHINAVVNENEQPGRVEI